MFQAGTDSVQSGTGDSIWTSGKKDGQWGAIESLLCHLGWGLSPELPLPHTIFSLSPVVGCILQGLTTANTSMLSLALPRQV